MIFGSKKGWSSIVQQKKAISEKKSGVITQGRREVEVATFLLSNDKNNVIDENLLIYC